MSEIGDTERVDDGDIPAKPHDVQSQHSAEDVASECLPIPTQKECDEKITGIYDKNEDLDENEGNCRIGEGDIADNDDKDTAITVMGENEDTEPEMDTSPDNNNAAREDEAIIHKQAVRSEGVRRTERASQAVRPLQPTSKSSPCEPSSMMEIAYSSTHTTGGKSVASSISTKNNDRRHKRRRVKAKFSFGSRRKIVDRIGSSVSNSRRRPDPPSRNSSFNNNSNHSIKKVPLIASTSSTPRKVVKRRQSTSSNPVPPASKTPTRSNSSTSAANAGGLKNGNSKTATTSEATVPRIQILDDEPIRLVNPLAELGPPVSSAILVGGQSTVSSLVGAREGDDEDFETLPIAVSDTDGDDTISNRTNGKINNKNNTGGKACTTSNNATATPATYTPMNDWLPLQDIWLGPPDTYPIAYWARLLGLSIRTKDENNITIDATDIPSPTTLPIDTMTNEIIDGNTVEYHEDIHANGAVRMTKEAILNSAQIRFRDDDPVYQIPTAGNFATHVWKGRKLGAGVPAASLSIEDEDDRVLGQYQDPLFERLRYFSNHTHNKYARYSIMGLKVEEKKKQHEEEQEQEQQLYVQRSGTSHGSRRTNSTVLRRRLSRESNEDESSTADVIVIPVSTQEHSKLQLPASTISELVRDVRELAIDENCCTRVQWNPERQEPDFNKLDGSNVLPPIKLRNNLNIVSTSDQKQSNKSDYHYSFHTLAQARTKFPELKDEFASIISSSTNSSTGAVVAGVTDGWIAIQHNPKSSADKKTPLEKTKNVAGQDVDSRLSNYSKCNMKTDSILPTVGITTEAIDDLSTVEEADNDNTVEEVPAPAEKNTPAPAVHNSHTGAVRELLPQLRTVAGDEPMKKGGISVAAYLTFQFVWFRDKTQAIEESELIVRVLAVGRYATDDNDSRWTGTTDKINSSQSDSDQLMPNSQRGHRESDLRARNHRGKTNEVDNELLLILISLMVAHARANSVWYASFPARSINERLLMETYFRMTGPTTRADDDGLLMMVCDMQKISYRYAMLLYKENRLAHVADQQARSVNFSNTDPDGEGSSFCAHKRRWLLRLPTYEEAKQLLDSQVEKSAPGDAFVGSLYRGMTKVTQQRTTSASICPTFSSASKDMQSLTVGLRVKLLDRNSLQETNQHMHGIKFGDVVADNKILQPELQTQNLSDTLSNTLQLLKIRKDGSDGDSVTIPRFGKEPPSLDFMRSFLLAQPDKKCRTDNASSPLVEELKSRQRDLIDLEKVLEPKLRSLLSSVIDERILFENEETQLRQLEEIRALKENKKMLDRRKELDQAWQKQLEQDMDAVCEICNDGEVTPDNQILFCEACNVAVHQMCYGIEKVPDGDYYCLPCRRLGRDRRNGGPGSIKPPPQPLPICCELCPLRQGAFVRTDKKPKPGSSPVDKWVHSVCAKWQGLTFVHHPDLVEDVTEIKYNFRRHGIRCEICHGEYGAMNRCMGGEQEGENEGCNKWFHVTCARAIGTLRVIHGENCKGPIEENPWRLMCPEHSNLDPDEIPNDAIPPERLILAALEFPPEPKPPPEPVANKPFNAATGREREYLLSKPEYESALITELLTKKFHGARCEVCDHVEEDSKNLTRCAGCHLVFCNACKILPDEYKGNFYYCPTCIHMTEQKKAGVQDTEVPSCAVCFQKGGFLRKAVCSPVTKKAFWKNHPNELKKTYFGRDLWVHSLCAFWHPKLTLPFDTGLVDLSNVVLSNGKSLIQNRIPCYLCGQYGGMKIYCKHEGCQMIDGHSTTFHITCARQAGLEIGLGEGDELDFYGHCYRHGGNAYNLRAKLEDMIEVEKRRSGKDLSRADAPMKFSNASRILNTAVQIIKMLGWAWRWTEWWVDYDSTWEPLLEPGQREDQMTKKELKIVESTRESRCADARRCRLAAFGAALRNRDYDTEDGFDNESLHRALRAILYTRSLVGPLEQYEIEFFVDWLGRAYRSKSKLLFLGEDKNKVSEKSSFTTHTADQSPKFMLVNRPIPGKQELAPGEKFEATVKEVDDFMLNPLVFDISDQATKQGVEGHALKKRKRKSEDSGYTDNLDKNGETLSLSASPESSPRPRGRPKKSIVVEETNLPTARGPGRPRKEVIEDSEIQSERENLRHSPLSTLSKKGNARFRQHGQNVASPDRYVGTGRMTKSLPDATKGKLTTERLADDSSRSTKPVKKGGSGSTDLSLYDITKWNATEEAKRIFAEVAKLTPFVQTLVVLAAKRGVYIEQVNLKTGETKGPYPSMKKAAVLFGINRDFMAPVLRGEQLSHGDLTWRYVYKIDRDEHLRRTASSEAEENCRSNAVRAQGSPKKARHSASRKIIPSRIPLNDKESGTAKEEAKPQADRPSPVRNPIECQSGEAIDEEFVSVPTSSTMSPPHSLPETIEPSTVEVEKKELLIGIAEPVPTAVCDVVKEETIESTNEESDSIPAEKSEIAEVPRRGRGRPSKRKEKKPSKTSKSSVDPQAELDIGRVRPSKCEEHSPSKTSVSSVDPHAEAEPTENIQRNVQLSLDTDGGKEHEATDVSARKDGRKTLVPQQMTRLPPQKRCGRRLTDLDAALKKARKRDAHIFPWKNRLLQRSANKVTYSLGLTDVVSPGQRPFRPPVAIDGDKTHSLQKEDDDDCIPISQMVEKRKSRVSSPRPPPSREKRRRQSPALSPVKLEAVGAAPSLRKRSDNQRTTRSSRSP